jgi:small-conductance mechanosensitive channel
MKRVSYERKINKQSPERMGKRLRNMSFNLGLDNIKQILIMVLMIVFVLAVFVTNIAFMYKIGIGALVFSMIFLTSLADQAAKKEEEQRKRAKF